MFPINNILATQLALLLNFRNLPGQAKYINSAESPIYVKAKQLWP
jgi:DNA primase